MTKICYVDKTFRTKSWRLINIANDICDEYMAQGYTLTLRQLYYQFVARGHIPNSQKEYNNLGNLISDARLAGHIDWDNWDEMKKREDAARAKIKEIAENWKD